MSRYPEIQLSRLREISWSEWDPIGLRSLDSEWQNNAVDEYDSYLLHVVSLLHRGETVEKAVAYLDWVGSDHMGLGPTTDRAHLASIATVAAIHSYLKTLPDGPLSLR